MDDEILELTSSDSEPDFFSSQARERAAQKAATGGINGVGDAGVVHGAHNERGNNDNGSGSASGSFHAIQNPSRNTNGNGKSNATPAPSGSQKTRQKTIPQKKGKTPIPPSADVINLTDSEPEVQVMQAFVAPTRKKTKKVGNAVAGPSRICDEDRLGGSQRRGGAVASGSGMNGSSEGGGGDGTWDDDRGAGLKRKQPLFLAGSQDEWGEEDFLDERMGERATKKGRVGDTDLHPQNGHRGDEKERDVVDLIMDQRQYPTWEGFDHGLLEDDDMYVPLDDERDRRPAQGFAGQHLPQQPPPQPQGPAAYPPHQPPEQPQPVPQQAQPIPDPVPQPAPQPEAQAQPAQQPPLPPSKDDIIAQVLSIVPDVQPEHLSGLVDRNIAQFGERTSELVIGMLFEDAGYPKVEKRGVKRGGDEGKGTEREREEKRQKVDYKSLDRDVSGGGYEGLALATLQLYFAHIPRSYLHDQLRAHRGLYAPTHLALLAAEKRYETQPRLKKPYEKGIYKPKKGGKGKGKTKARQGAGAGPVYGHAHVHYEVEIPESDEEGGGRVDAVQADEDVQRKFDEELGWLEGYLAGGEEGEEGMNGTGTADEAGGGGEADVKGKGKERAVDGVEGEGEGEGESEIECGCCFGEYPFSQMVQCPEAHLFCKGCLTTYASTQLSSLSCVINCMSSSPVCALPFPASELRRALPENLLKLYDRVTQQDEIAKAGLEGLEECPFCEWKCVMEVSVEQDKLFRCANEDGGCGVTSCRMCKKLDHLPKSCQEVEEDKVLDGRHAIEEAMTAALMRNCPNCKKAFIKEQGCNKMTCPHCGTLSCYICRQVIKGYDHFDQMPNKPGSSRRSGKCSLWDKVEERHAEEVKAAHDKAMAKYREEHPDVETDDLKVDLPPAPPAPPAPVLPPIHHLPVRGRRGRGRGPPAAMFPAHPGLVHAPMANPVQPLVIPPAQGRRGRRGPAAIVNPPAPPPPQPAHRVPLVYNPGPLAANNPAIAHLIPPAAPPAIPQQHNFGFAMGFQGLYEQQVQLQLEHQRLQQEQQQRAQQQQQWQREQQQMAAMHMRAVEQHRQEADRRRLAQQEQRLREAQERAREHQQRMQEQQREREQRAVERARRMAVEVQQQQMGMQGLGGHVHGLPQLGQVHEYQVPHQLHHQHQAQHQYHHVHQHHHHVQQAQVVAQPQAQIQNFHLAQQVRMTRAQAAAAAALPAQGQGQGVLRRG